MKTSGDILINVAYAGLCGSDILCLDGQAHSVTLGHEVTGTIAFDQDDFRTGDKVAILPLIFDDPRADNHPSNIVGSIGKTRDGGFKRTLLAPRKNIFRIPADADLAKYTLADVLACALHCFNLAGRPQRKQTAIIGDGAIGLMCMKIFLLYGNDVFVFGKHNGQLALSNGARFHNSPSEISGDRFDVIVEAVGRAQSDTLSLAIRLANSQAIVVVAGVFTEGFFGTIDFRAAFIKECSIKGANSYIYDEFHQALALLERDDFLVEDLITDIFSLDDFNDGLYLMRHKRRAKPVVKILFTPLRRY